MPRGRKPAQPKTESVEVKTEEVKEVKQTIPKKEKAKKEIVIEMQRPIPITREDKWFLYISYLLELIIKNM